MNKAQLINQDSGITEYYTPLAIVEAARRVMGGIDLDPASSLAANVKIQATEFFTHQDEGLIQDWWGRVWMNHPFSRENNERWIMTLVRKYLARDIDAACCITYASTSEQWFQPLLDYPMAFITPRVNYLLPDGTVKKGVTKGSAVTYLGDDLDAFYREFDGRIGSSKYTGKVKA